MSRVLKWTFAGLGALLALPALVFVVAWLWLESSLPQTEGEATLPNLEAPVEVLRDLDGMVTLRAESMRDAYMALGYVHAQDRLWQMDMMRRLGAGRVSEILGDFTFRHDRFMRTMDFEGLARAQFQVLAPETRADIQAYTDGVNAFLETRKGALPIEFALLRYSPEPWEPHHSLLWGKLMALQLSGNYREEIQRAEFLQRLPPDKVAFLWPDYENDAPIIDSDRRSALLGLELKGLADILPWAVRPKSASNSWVLAGDHTESGRPLLANDPHLGLDAPGTWYLAHIETPELTVSGATSPGIPYHLIGHNGDLAWGFTTTHSDTQDLFIERLTADGAAYRTPDGPRPFQTRIEEIRVRGENEARQIKVRNTRHGPVISDVLGATGGSDTEERTQVLALAWPALRSDDRTPDALRGINRARDWESLMATLPSFHAPQQNILFAERGGAIGLVAPARVPLRRNGDGRVPVPGWSGEYDWEGFVPFQHLPVIVNPPSGRIVAANNKLVDDGYPYLLTAQWPPPARARRIESLLEKAGPPYGWKDMADIQMDAYSREAADLLSVLLDVTVEPRAGAPAEAFSLLQQWDHVMSREAAAPLVYAAWLEELHRRLFSDDLADAFPSYERPNPAVIRDALRRDPTWCDDRTTRETEDCTGVATKAFAAAIAGLQETYGPVPAEWRWGAAHSAEFRHPVIDRLPLLGELLSFGLATDGGDETVNRGGLSWRPPTPFSHRHGAGMRAIFDLSDLDESRFQIAAGQSGNPLSETYGNFAVRWRDGVFVKLVGDATEGRRRLTLNPR
jgi:penicillin amidase